MAVVCCRVVVAALAPAEASATKAPEVSTVAPSRAATESGPPLGLALVGPVDSSYRRSCPEVFQTFWCKIVRSLQGSEKFGYTVIKCPLNDQGGGLFLQETCKPKSIFFKLSLDLGKNLPKFVCEFL